MTPRFAKQAILPRNEGYQFSSRELRALAATTILLIVLLRVLHAPVWVYVLAIELVPFAGLLLKLYRSSFRR
jgi:hypothetical protein